MPDFSHRHPENAPGKYFVDAMCLDCELCLEMAPMVFKRNDRDGSAYVARQPETAEERMLCDEAVWGCPCEAIGDDGDRQDWATPIAVDRPDSATGVRVCKHCQKTESLWIRLRKFLFGG